MAKPRINEIGVRLVARSSVSLARKTTYPRSGAHGRQKGERHEMPRALSMRQWAKIWPYSANSSSPRTRRYVNLPGSTVNGLTLRATCSSSSRQPFAEHDLEHAVARLVSGAVDQRDEVGRDGDRRRRRRRHREHRAGEVDARRRAGRLAHLEVLDEQCGHDLHLGESSVGPDGLHLGAGRLVAELRIAQPPARTGEARRHPCRRQSTHRSPVWVDLDGDQIVFMTSADTIKGKSILRDGRVAVCFDDEQPPFSFVTCRARPPRPQTRLT